VLLDLFVHLAQQVRERAIERAAVAAALERRPLLLREQNQRVRLRPSRARDARLLDVGVGVQTARKSKSMFLPAQR
jgi:hypothetical protein